ncbi:MAG: 4-(cytidine 5'-diphospho)-2-C-methyl-D-erythritol kinase [Planctomycetota bacterium]
MLHEKARAKVNLALRVLGQRPDGYHELWTIFDELELHDDLSHEPDQAEPRLLLEVEAFPGRSRPGEGVPAAEENLVLRAARGFHTETGLASGGLFRLRKRTPAGAGLGGGSSDAAAALRLLAVRHGLNPASPELIALAQRVGADVPFFLSGYRAWAEGRGDRIHPLRLGPRLHYVLIVPWDPCPTRSVFLRWQGRLTHKPGALDWSQIASGPGSDPSRRQADLGAATPADAASKFLQGLLPDDSPDGLAQGLFNDLKEAACDVLPGLTGLCQRLLGSEIPDLHLSGSGSTLFLATGSASRAQDLASWIRRRLGEEGSSGLEADVIVTRSRL